jgi:serine/threonine protein kinase/Tol biopolymer transport system component
MDPERWRKIEELYHSVLERDSKDRGSFLAAACGADQELRDEVESLLAQNSSPVLLDRPAWESDPSIIAEAQHGTETMAQPLPSELRSGSRFGRYEIQALLGAGGGGQVYQAFDPTLRRQLAIKVIAPTGALDPDTRRRFFREAETASGLNHPNIVTVYEIGVEQSADYIAMEYIAGKSLRELIPSGGLALKQFFPWAIQIADALAAAHEAQVIHRDLKPGNIMITDRGAAKVVDFGIAKALNAEDAGLTLTEKGMVVGTCSYMAPEQAEGKAIDARADLFSFGTVLFEMATGQRAFPGTSKNTIIGAVLHTDPPAVSTVRADLPKDLEWLIQVCLNKSPAERWQSAGDLKTLLTRGFERWKLQDSETAAVQRGSKKVLGAILAAGIVVGLGGAYLYSRRSVKPEPEFRTLAITSDLGLNQSPSLSADGRLMAYASDRENGNLDIWVQQIGGQAPIRLTHDREDEKDPDISPDGTHVAYRSEKEGGGVYVIPALGGEPVLLAQGGRNPRFSPDGKSIAYWVGSESSQMAVGSAQTFIIPVGGGQPQALGRDFAAARSPVWSPDGNSVLVLGRKSADMKTERPDWWMVTTFDGKAKSTGIVSHLWDDEKGISRPPGNLDYTPLVWTKDRGIVFAAKSGDAVNLWSIGIGPGNKPARITSGAGSEIHVSLSETSDTRRMAFANTEQAFNLWQIPIDTEAGVVKGEIRRLTSNLSAEFYPSLSADGTKLAFARQSALFSLCVLDLTSGKETSLLGSKNALYSIRLSGDGKLVYFWQPPSMIGKIDSRGGSVTKVCEHCGTPTWASHDGRSLLVQPASGPDHVVGIDTSTGKATAVVDQRDKLYSADLSLDGQWVAFKARSMSSPNSRIYVARLNDGHAAPVTEWIAVTDEDAQYQGPRWSPAGSVLYYVSDRDGFRCIWARRLDRATKKPVGDMFAIHHLHSARHSLQHQERLDDRINPTVAGDKLVIAIGELTGNIWMREQKLK